MFSRQPMKKKFLIIFVLVSLTVHALVIAFSFFIDKPAVPHNDTAMKIDLKPLQQIEKPRAPDQEKLVQPAASVSTNPGIAHEASVGLENPGGVYEPYLIKIRRKIDSFWAYPPQALAENREGSAVIRFTIAANGSLTASSVLSSSGSTLLDNGALACIRAASPFEPLPGSFNISLLNVTATFSYRINL
jgi:TonB family protein